MQIAEITCLWYGSFHTQTVRVDLVRDTRPRTRDGDDRGYGLPLVNTDLTSPAEDLVARYAARWSIEVTFTDARQILGVGEARNHTHHAVQRTVPFGLTCLSLVTLWYATTGHAPADVTEHRARARWYTTKTEPSFADMTAKLRRVIIAARFRHPAPTRQHTNKSTPYTWPGQPPTDKRESRGISVRQARTDIFRWIANQAPIAYEDQPATLTA